MTIKRLWLAAIALLLCGSVEAAQELTAGATDEVVYFVAVDGNDLHTRLTGLSGFTVYYSIAGGAMTAMTTPTVTQLDATNAPGEYKLLVDEAGMTTLAAGKDQANIILSISQEDMDRTTVAAVVKRTKITAGSTSTAQTGDSYAVVAHATYGLEEIKGVVDDANDQADAIYERLGEPNDTDLATDVGAVKAHLDSRLTRDVNDTYDLAVGITGFAAIKTQTAAIEADTQDLQTQVGTPAALDGGTASLAGMLTKLADDNGGADYDATTDSMASTAAVTADSLLDEMLADHDTVGSVGWYLLKLKSLWKGGVPAR